MPKHFPRFFFSNPKNQDASGPVLFHMNYPRCIFNIQDGVVTLAHVVDHNVVPPKLIEVKEDAEHWLKENEFLLNGLTNSFSKQKNS